MIGERTIHDISIILGEESFPFPGDPPFSKEMLLSITDGGPCDVSKLSMSAHSGTHIDTPAHFIAGGNNLDDYPARSFILPARVVAIEDKQSITPENLRYIDIDPGDALLFKTDNSATGRCRSGVFSERFVYLTPESAAVCMEKKVGMVGLDYITVEKQGDETYPIHRKLLGSGILILEGINLKGVPPGGYTLICLPLKIKGGEASPVRAILVDSFL